MSNYTNMQYDKNVSSVDVWSMYSRQEGIGFAEFSQWDKWAQEQTRMHETSPLSEAATWVLVRLWLRAVCCPRHGLPALSETNVTTCLILIIIRDFILCLWWATRGAYHTVSTSLSAAPVTQLYTYRVHTQDLKFKTIQDVNFFLF